MKFGQLVEQNKRNIFIQNHAEGEAWRLAPDLLLFFEKDLCKCDTAQFQYSYDDPELAIQ